jgi:hypothetical protein
VQPVASRSTDYALPALIYLYIYVYSIETSSDLDSEVWCKIYHREKILMFTDILKLAHKSCKMFRGEGHRSKSLDNFQPETQPRSTWKIAVFFGMTPYSLVGMTRTSVSEGCVASILEADFTKKHSFRGGYRRLVQLCRTLLVDGRTGEDRLMLNPVLCSYTKRLKTVYVQN